MSLEATRKRVWKEIRHHLWRVAVGVVGMVVLLIGIVMLVAPGPAVIVIPLGLGILATQFSWARRVLHHFHHQVAKLRGSVAAPSTSEEIRDGKN